VQTAPPSYGACQADPELIAKYHAPRHESEIEPSRTGLGCFIEGVAHDWPGLHVVPLPRPEVELTTVACSRRVLADPGFGLGRTPARARY